MGWDGMGWDGMGLGGMGWDGMGWVYCCDGCCGGIGGAAETWTSVSCVLVDNCPLTPLCSTCSNKFSAKLRCSSDIFRNLFAVMIPKPSKSSGLRCSADDALERKDDVASSRLLLFLLLVVGATGVEGMSSSYSSYDSKWRPLALKCQSDFLLNFLHINCWRSYMLHLCKKNNSKLTLNKVKEQKDQ